MVRQDETIQLSSSITTSNSINQPSQDHPMVLSELVPTIPSAPSEHDHCAPQISQDHPSSEEPSNTTALPCRRRRSSALRTSTSRRMHLVQEDSVPVLDEHDNDARDMNAIHGSSGDMMTMFSSTSTLGMDDPSPSVDTRIVDGARTTTTLRATTVTPMERRRRRMDHKAAQLSRARGDDSCSSNEQQGRGPSHPATIRTGGGGEMSIHSDQDPSTELEDAVDTAGTDADELVGVNVRTVPRPMTRTGHRLRNHLAVAEDSTLSISPHTSNHLHPDEDDDNVRPGAVFVPIRALGAPNRPYNNMGLTESSSHTSSQHRRSQLFSSGVFARVLNSHGITAASNHRSTIIAESVDADTIVYASNVNVIHEQESSKICCSRYTMLGALMITFALILALGLGITLGTAKTGPSPPSVPTSSEGSPCSLAPVLQDIYDICYCYGNASLLFLNANETEVYTIVSETLMINGILNHTLDRDSCDPEHQAILAIANFKRLGLDINPNDLNLLLSPPPPPTTEASTLVTAKTIMTDTIVEQFILRLLFLGINEDGHAKNGREYDDDWRTSSVVCRWLGITCNTILGRVEVIRLHNVDYTGTLPWQVGLLSHLQILDLSNNPNLVGTIPTELGMASSLHTLDLTSCGLSGTLPTELGQLQVLDHMVLSNNTFRGTIPTEYGMLHRLRHFQVDTNYLTGRLPSEIGTMTNLERLLVHHNQLSKSIPTTLGILLMFQQLQQVDLSDNMFSGTLAEAMFDSTQLHDTRFTEGRQVSTINNTSSDGRTVSSSYLVVARTQLTGPIPESFCQQQEQQQQQYTNSTNNTNFDENTINTIPTTRTSGGTIVLVVSCYLDHQNINDVSTPVHRSTRTATTASVPLLERNCSCCLNYTECDEMLTSVRNFFG